MNTNNTKFEFTEETEVESGVTLRRIRYLRAGALGGWIEREENLDISGNALILDNACVFGNARVSGNARVVGKKA